MLRELRKDTTADGEYKKVKREIDELNTKIRAQEDVVKSYETGDNDPARLTVERRKLTNFRKQLRTKERIKDKLE